MRAFVAPLLNAVILACGKVNDRAITPIADKLVHFLIVIGGSLTPMLRRRLPPGWSIQMDWRVRFVLLCTTMALLEEVVTTTMTNIAPLLGTTPSNFR